MKTIIAPSGAGKTVFCKTHKWCKDIDLYPPAALIYRKCWNKFGDKWWLKPSNLRYKDSQFEALLGRMILVPHWFATAELVLATQASVFVIPDPGLLVTQQKLRVSGGDLSHPEMDLKQATVEVMNYFARAKRLHCLIFKSFDELKGATVTSGGT